MFHISLFDNVSINLKYLCFAIKICITPVVKSRVVKEIGVYDSKELIMARLKLKVIKSIIYCQKRVCVCERERNGREGQRKRARVEDI